MPNISRSDAREIVREGAEEVKAKLREDLSRWTRTRRYVSIKPQISCLACDGAGKVQCAACGGAGKSGLVHDSGEAETCPRCGGAGAITCVECAGKGSIANRHRKIMLWILGLGAVAWLLILFQLLGRDILPEQRAAILQRGEHGQALQVAPGARQEGAGAGITAGSPQHGASVNPGQTPGTSGYAPVPPGAPNPSGNSLPYGGSAVSPGYGGPTSGSGRGIIGGAGRPSGGGNSIPGPPGSVPR